MTLKELMMVTDESLSIAVSGVEEEVAKMNVWTCPEDVAEQTILKRMRSRKSEHISFRRAKKCACM